jgi:hypothetical protein
MSSFRTSLRNFFRHSDPSSFSCRFKRKVSESLILLAAVLVAWGLAAGVPQGIGGELQPAARIELEATVDPRAPLATAQEWAKLLSRLGPVSVRVTTGTALRPPSVQVEGSPQAPVYRVYAQIDSRGDLILPGGKRFGLSQGGQIAVWLDELRRLGPEETRPRQEKFGLTAEELLRLRQALCIPLAIRTKDRPRLEVLRQLLPQSPVPIVDRSGQLTNLDPQDLVREELSELSLGTALAYLLRPAGLAAVPARVEAKSGTNVSSVGMVIVRATTATEIWPVGWPPVKSPPDLVPGLYQFLEVNVQGVSAARVVQAVEERVGIIVLWDYNALARWGIDPAKTSVRFPPRSTSYAQLLRHCLFQAGLKYELRQDEAGKPFLWITTTKPL